MLGGATVMLCVGSSLAVLITGRVLQGMSAANVWSVGLALLVDTVGQTEIGQIMGTVFLAMSLGFLISPLLGGIVYANAGYYPVFYMAFGAIVLDILLRLLLIEKKVAKKWLDEPVAPGLSDTLPVALQLPTADPAMVLDKHSEHANIVPATDASPFRLPPVITLLSSRRLLSALWCCLVQATITTAFDSVLPLYVQSTFGWSSTGAGLMFLPLIIPSLVAPVIGSVADKYGSRYLAFCGFLGTAPILVLLRLVTFNSIGQKVLLAALLALIGFALSCAFVPTMTEVTYVVEARERKTPGIFGKQGAYAQAYSLFNVFFASGTLIGPIWGGFVVSGAGWGTMSLTLGILSAVTAIPALIWTGGFIRDPGRSKDRNSGSGEGPGDIELRSPPAQSGSLTAVEPATEESVDFISHA
ncbi:hypothetical protein MMC19_005987 [Ptychographa xylographoides]|nr:hypothetical protein [Ptychographa xylographoides]